MILLVLKQAGIDADYMVGAQLEGFDVMVKLSDEARFMVLEGDEYLTSPIDPRPKFHLYKPDIALLSGVAWDHINVFKTFENYVEQFTTFIRQITPGGLLVYCKEDDILRHICPESGAGLRLLPYSFPDHFLENGTTYIKFRDSVFPLGIFGDHNLLNLNGARLVCNQMGVDDETFFSAITTFAGASKRLELIGKNASTSIFKDFAHSPSKLEATVKAVKGQFSGKKLVACIELHTFSSLSREFLSHYKGTMDSADLPIVYFNPHALQMKKLPPLTPDQVREGFALDRIEVFNDSSLLNKRLLGQNWKDTNLLMMSSGDFDGLNLADLAEKILEDKV